MAWFLVDMPNQKENGYEVGLNERTRNFIIVLHMSSLPKLQVQW